MQIVGLIVTLCLVLGISVVIAIIIFFPYSTVNQTYWEPIFRSYDENIRAVSKSHLLTALLDRYEKYVRPFSTYPSEGKAPAPVIRSPEYLETTKKLHEMVNSHSSYVKMFPEADQVLVFATRVLNTLSAPAADRNQSQSTKFPMVGKVVLFSIPTFALINKNESLNLTVNESMKLKTCWESYVPGIPITVAFSTDYKHMAIAYRVMVSGGFKYRARYYHELKCDPAFNEEPNTGYYEKYVNLIERELNEYSAKYDDLYLRAHAYISALAVERNKVAYSVSYDVSTFHLVERDVENNVWIEHENTPAIQRAENIYEFCYDLFMVSREDSTLLISFTKKGNSLEQLNQDLDIYEQNNNSIQQVYHKRFEARNSLVFSLADLESPPVVNSLFALSESKDLGFIVKNYDRMMLLQLPPHAKPVPYTIARKIHGQIIAGLKDLSVVASYPKDTSSIVFYVNQKNTYAGRLALTSRTKRNVLVAVA
eukprot:TRINITY_DN9528_c0_g1_i13.p1 TRINITY_DN9528_c0_g1~~TRINITY_DN9528_c0_g1_i13.p1  ORF type:complete len:481 (-),score=87.73 TRINITY_DN9528_c0_g1_i13:494-1936(-)